MEWIRNSKALIQYGSSSAIQAHILNVPVMSLMPDLPDNLKNLEKYQAKEVSIIYKEINKLVEGCVNLCNDHKKFELKQNSLLDKIIFSRKSVDSSKRIVDELDDLFLELDFKKNNFSYGPFLL